MLVSMNGLPSSYLIGIGFPVLYQTVAAYVYKGERNVQHDYERMNLATLHVT